MVASKYRFQANVFDRGKRTKYMPSPALALGRGRRGTRFSRPRTDHGKIHMSQPLHGHHPGDGTFLGTYGRLDLYFGPQGLPAPTLIARWRSGAKDVYQWQVDLSPGATSHQQAFDHAVSLARQQGLLN